MNINTKTPAYTTKFKKDYESAVKQGRNMTKLTEVMDALLKDKPLSPIRHDHALRGNFKNSRECHIESDWLLIYKPSDKRILFERTGTHTELLE